MMNLKDAQSAIYLETVAIPGLKGTNYNEMALEICDTLETHYRKQRSKMKALEVAAMHRDILKDMLFGDVG